MQKRSIVVLLLLALLTSCAVKEQHPIMGEWELIGASFTIDESCLGSTINFTEDGVLISKSDSLIERKSYKVKPYKKGYLIETCRISDNNKNNCQGMPAALARKHPVREIYLELVDDGSKLKMHFHPVLDKGYLIVERL